MNLDVTEEERNAMKHALEVYLSDLTTEIGKTDNRDWRDALYKERDVLGEAIEKLAVN